MRALSEGEQLAQRLYDELAVAKAQIETQPHGDVVMLNRAGIQRLVSSLEGMGEFFRLQVNGALAQDSESDYTLKPEHRSAWVTVDTLSVYIKREDEGVAVDIFPRGREADDSIAGTWALYWEGEPDEL